VRHGGDGRRRESVASVQAATEHPIEFGRQAARITVATGPVCSERIERDEQDVGWSRRNVALVVNVPASGDDEGEGDTRPG
jgi:hypothetical protein